MDGQINLFDYLEATTEYKGEEGSVPAIGKDFKKPSTEIDTSDKAEDQILDRFSNELEVFIKNGFTILEKPFRFPDGLKTKWQPIELLLFENGKFVTCSGSYKDMTFRRSEYVKASLVGWKQQNSYE